MPGNIAELFRSLVAHAREPMIVIDKAWVVLFENDAAGRFLPPASDRRGTSLLDAVHEDDVTRLRSAFERASLTLEPTPIIQFRLRRDDGQWFVLDAIGRYDSPLGRMVALVHIRDLTDYRRLKQRLRFARKLAGVGRLTVAIADELEHIVSSVRHHLRTLETNSPQRYAFGLRAILRGAARIDTVAQGLRLASVRQSSLSVRVDVRAILDEVAAGARVEVRVDATQTWTVVEHDALRQGIVHLIDALRSMMPGTSPITIVASDLTLAPAPPYSRNDADLHDYVEIQVSNAGSSTPSDDVPSDVFVYGAVGSEANALPLAVLWLRDVVGDAGGFIDVDNPVDGGVVVRMILPVE